MEVAGAGGFQLQARIEYPDGSSEVIGTDETWRGIPCPYLLPGTSLPPEEQKRYGRPVVLFDAAAEPVGWQLPNFDDRNWPACRVGSPPGATLVMSELPPLMEAFYPVFDVKPVSGDVTIPSEPLTPGHPIVVKGDGEFIVHFSRVMAGRCGLAVDGCAGAEVYLISNETEATRRAPLLVEAARRTAIFREPRLLLARHRARRCAPCDQASRNPRGHAPIFSPSRWSIGDRSRAATKPSIRSGKAVAGPPKSA